MKQNLKSSFPREILEKTARHIAESQTKEGAIPWFKGGHIDTWNHTEALMGLTVGGYLQEAEAALDWLQRNQLDNGAWLSSYGSEVTAGTKSCAKKSTGMPTDVRVVLPSPLLSPLAPLAVVRGVSVAAGAATASCTVAAVAKSAAKKRIPCILLALRSF